MASENDKLDIFISYSTKNKNVADAVVANFEHNGIKCWYAPRDIMPGKEWVSAIKEGLHDAKVFVLIFTAESNLSRQVMNEVALAFNAGKTIVPFRLTEEMMNDELEYYLTRVHWLDAVSKPLEKSIDALRSYVEVILQKSPAGKEAAGAERKQPSEMPAKEAAEGQTGAAKAKKSKASDKSSEKKKKKPWLWIGVAAAAVLLLALGVFAITKLAGPNKDELMAEGVQAYYYGDCGTKDDAKARELFEKAAKAKAADAYYYLGELDERDYNYKAAKENYEKGIEAGSDLCRLGLGSLYQRGYGVKGDDKKAWELYNEALDNGCAEADYYRAGIVNAGLAGQELSAEKAMKYYRNVTEDGKEPWLVANAYAKIGEIYRKGGVGVEKDLEKAIESYGKITEAMDGKMALFFQEYDLGLTYNSMDEAVKSDEHYTAAFETCKEMADAGNIYCMYWCGRCYQAGNGVEQSYREAIDLYEKANEAARERNNKDCCFEALLDLGQLCERGHGFSQDYEKAYDYYKEAADAGYGKAAYYIGLLYHWGHRGVDADGNYDYELARQWYDKALECGCTDAYNNIGVIYKEGLGKYPADTDKALEYYQKGADMGNSLCMRNIAYIYDGRGEYEEAIPWFLKASDFGDNVSDYYLGYYYETARGVEKNEAKAFEYYLKAANAGHVNAMIIVTECYQYGELTAEKNAEKAFSWCQKAAAEEKPEAMDMLGNMYMSGFGTKKDASTASKWFEKAANLGYAQAAYHLACLLFSGEDGVPRDAATGLVWMRRAAESDVADSKYWLGYYLVKGGDGITKNEKEGLSILEEVAAGGNTNGMKVIADYHYDHFNTETAVQWYERAVNAGLKDGETYLRLGRYYRDSAFPDEATAMKWLTKAYEENANLDAADYGFLGHRYNMGEIVKQDLDLAFQCFMKGAEVGDSYCMAYLGLFYETGKVGEPNPQEALKWYGAAIQTGLQVDYCTNRIEIMVRKGQITEEEAAQYLPNQN